MGLLGKISMYSSGQIDHPMPTGRAQARKASEKHPIFSGAHILPC